ncbi:MAG: gamma-glutamyl-phosphate reductase, partial [Deltaproteobacteria bacterium]|nr:gamma-glutamyl-phosphate reductase [Deltaproteobacteria bacterium]
MDIAATIKNMALEARVAARRLAALPGPLKNQALTLIADRLGEEKEAIQKENRQDVEAAQAQGHPAAFIDRLTLTDKVVQSMVNGLREVVQLPDPVGAVTSMWRRPNGLLVGRQRIPLGVIGFIYESRPNVT